MELALREQRSRREHERQGRLGSPGRWRYLFAALLLLTLGAIALLPGLPLNMRMYAVVHGVCAQEHNEFLAGLQLPLCARNTGIYGAFLITLFYLQLIGKGHAAGMPPWPITSLLALFVALMGLDGLNSMANDLGLGTLYQPFNALRTLTGIGMGVTIAVFVRLVLNSALLRDARRDERIIANWLELAGALLASLLVLLIIYGGLAWGFWLVAAVSFFGITGTLFLVFLLVISLLMGYEASVTRWQQLARPATFALLLTLLMLGATSSLRFWLEAQALL